MSWAIGYDGNWQRDIGYGVPAYCDHPGCEAEIDRGLSYVCCNQEPYGGDAGCGLYFCPAHQDVLGQCARCQKGQEPFTPKPDHPEWIAWKRADESWAEWRATEEGQAFMAATAISIPPQHHERRHTS